MASRYGHWSAEGRIPRVEQGIANCNSPSQSSSCPGNSRNWRQYRPSATGRESPTSSEYLTKYPNHPCVDDKRSLSSSTYQQQQYLRLAQGVPFQQALLPVARMLRSGPHTLWPGIIGRLTGRTRLALRALAMMPRTYPAQGLRTMVIGGP
jgi:hypothetical protein